MNKHITYNAMVWLLAAQFVVMLPFAWELPIWLIPVMLVSAGWRLWGIRAGESAPAAWLKMLVLALGVGGLWASHVNFPSLEAMSALLLLGFAFKALEVSQRRDAIVVVLTGYFLVALQFLYAQTMFAAVYSVLSLVVLTATLMAIQHAIQGFSSVQNSVFNFNFALSMLLACLPLMVVIFVVTPRFQPFWSIPLTTSGQAKTGIGDTLAPGDIENISQSSELAFRASFQGAAPAHNQLYWRGLVLTQFDGQRWQQFKGNYSTDELIELFKTDYSLYSAPKDETGGIAYEVVYEKTAQPWLFTLTPSLTRQLDVLHGVDYRLMSSQVLQAPFLLRATFYPERSLDLPLSSEVRQATLQLPHHQNPRTLQLAQTLRAQSVSESDYIQRVLVYLREQQFAYTLRPPLMGTRDTIDTFLFEAKRGFCAHYAGGFVYLMRAAGIPARIVAGYQGGEWSPDKRYISIHQYDAHAWAEVWLPKIGWMRVDPTAAIAPERIERGLEAAVQNEQTFLANERFNVRDYAWLKAMRQQWDSVQYGWQRWVLGYDSASQTALMQQWLGALSPSKIILAVLGVMLVFALGWASLLGLLRRAPKEALEHRLYRQFCLKMAKRGVNREVHLPPTVFADLAIQHCPEWQEQIALFNQCYMRICYDTEVDKLALLRQLQQQLRRMR